MSQIALRVARTELRRTLRSAGANRTRIALYLVAALLFFLPVLLFGSLLLSTAGEQLAGGAFGEEALALVPGVTTGAVAVSMVALALFAAVRTVTTVGAVDQPANLLISTSLRNVVTGLVLREAILFALWLGIPILILSSAFAWGATAPFIPLFALATFLLMLAVAVPVGFVVGLVVRHLLTVYEPVARYRTLLFVLLGLAYFAGIALGWLDRVVFVLFDLLGDSPLGWPGDLLLVALPGIEGSIARAGGAAVACFAVSAGALVLGTRIAAYHWFADPAQTDDTTVSLESRNRLETVLSGIVSLPTRTVTTTAIRRTKRAPSRLAYAAYPLFGAFFFAEQVAQTGQLPTTAAVLLAVYVVWIAGVLFTLNVLGDHGPAMPSVLTSTVSGWHIVAGTALAGILVSLPLALLVPPVAGVLSPLTLLETGLLTIVTVAGVTVSPLLAAGVGSWFPRFGAVRITSNREAVMPSKAAFLAYSLSLALPLGAGAVLWFDSAPGAIATGLSFVITFVAGFDITIPAGTLTAVAWVVLVAGLAAPLLSVRYAIHRFDSYRPY